HRPYVPHAYKGARELVQAWAEKGYVPLYLTSRPSWLAPSTREWTTALQFPPGPSAFAESHLDVLPDHAAAFKAQYLQNLVKSGFKIDYAYGNEPHDVRAYTSSGVPAAHIFIMGLFEGEGFEPLQGDYYDHVRWVQQQPDAAD
ncbi:MAG TPA: hypothetical protein VFH51_18160, partial [Myxococcota bacterium]|nr:hypothetical protein [Myxococcota bacterium]